MANGYDEPECDSCGSTGVPLESYESFKASLLKGAPKMLCGLCASTPAGNAYEYPEQYPHRDVLRTLCFIGNELLKRMPAPRDGGDDAPR